MPLFWIVHDLDGERRVMIREDTSVIFAKIKASIDGLGGTFVEAHALDAGIARKVPRKMIGKTLTGNEAASLLDKLG